MRKILLFVSALLGLSATLAWAAPGIDLAWNQCRGHTGAAFMKTSPCVSNIGSQSLFASFNAPASINQLEGAEVVIDYQVSGAAFPCWWDFTSIRSGALTALYVPPTDVDGDVLVACGTCSSTPCPALEQDGYYFLAKGGTGGGAGTVPVGNTAQLRGMVSIRAGTGGPVPPDVQQYCMGFRITNALTGPSCTGCSNAVTLTLSRITLIQPGVPNIDLTQRNLGNTITWNTGIVPTASRTWGAVKALYRN